MPPKISLKSSEVSGTLMHRRAFLSSCFGALSASAASPPNVVIFVADDLGYGETGFQGNPEIPTPHIDSIARNGVRFTQGYVTAPFCCPSRAGLITGRYQTRFGHELNAIGRQNAEPGVGLPLRELTLAERLKKLGYRTACIGKWHLGGSGEFLPQKRGFDEFYGFLYEGHYYVPPPYEGVESHLRNPEPPYDEENPVRRGNEPLVEKEYFTNALTREALRFLNAKGREPFLLYVPYNAVHSPMQAALADTRRFAHIADLHRRVFAGLLSAMDRSIGEILKKLPANTLVFFLSDNGGPTAELTSSNKPLRGFKGQLYEGGIRVPFAMQWKGRIRGGRVYERPVSSLDIVPTVLAAAGAELPTNLDGADLVPYLEGKRTGDPHAQLFWRYGQNLALRQGDWKVVRQAARGQAKAEFELFDLSRDPGETTNQSAGHPEVLARLRGVLDGMNREMVEPLWGRR
ncbi:MAG: N-acetylgalactosamine-4-sulfatase [Acidobacteria bacterium]|nr:N-acetylgalactosamine-4-sulfatase [Acidobacteriota bacterium]